MPAAKLHHTREGNGPDLLLVHGVGSNHTDWQAISEKLARRFTVLRCDLRGHGQSPAPDGDWTINDLSSDLIALLDALNIQKTHLAGFSLGGLIAQRFALDHPQRLHKLSLICSTTGRSESERASALERMQKLQQLPAEEYIEQSIHRWFTPEFITERPDVIEHKRTLISSMDKDAYARAYKVLVDTNQLTELSGIKTPTLIIAAENDIGSPPHMGQAMHQRIDGSQLVVLPRLKHSVLLEAPDIVGGLLREFHG